MNVKVIRQDSGIALIEWNDADGVHRGVVPQEVVIDEEIDTKLLSLALPYGMDWEAILGGGALSATPEIMARNLRKAGVWTLRDIHKNPQAALGAIQAAYQMDVQTLIKLSEQYIRDQGGKI